MLAIVAPGQGAQTPGFLAPWLDQPAFAERLRAHAAHLDMPLDRLGADPEVPIRDTAVVQPLLVASGLAAAHVLLDVGTAVGAVAGHSVGELTAAALAGVVAVEDALDLAATRGRAMAEAAAARPTGMAAVVGGDRDDVLRAATANGLALATVNGPYQVVVAGTDEQIAALAAQPPLRARVVAMPVAGAFHTEHMQPALSLVRAAAADLRVHDPRCAFVTNRDGSVLSSGPVVVDHLIEQIVRVVRWDLCTDRLAQMGTTGILELPPAGTLTALARRALPGVATFALTSPDDLDHARSFVAHHSAG